MTGHSTIAYFARSVSRDVRRHDDGRIRESTPQPVSDVDRHRARTRRAIEAHHERQRERDDDADLGW